MPSPSETVGIAGTGRVAQALGRLLNDKGERVAAIAGRSPVHTVAAASFIGPDVEALSFEALPARARRILIAVADDAVPAVAALLAEAGMSGGVALHTCGALGPEALAPLSEAGVACGVFHPLQTVPSPEQGLRLLPGAAAAVSGSGEALEWARQLAALLGGVTLEIESGRWTLYHAAAVMASNYAVALVDAAAILMRAAGVADEAALRALGPLLRASVQNALETGPTAALTGPIARGDAGTVEAHLRALAEAGESVGNLYRAAGLQALDIARRRGLPETQARALEKILRESDERNV